MDKLENFKECIKLEDANKISFDDYRYTGFDSYRGYMFVRRQKKGGK